MLGTSLLVLTSLQRPCPDVKVEEAPKCSTHRLGGLLSLNSTVVFIVPDTREAGGVLSVLLSRKLGRGAASVGQ